MAQGWAAMVCCVLAASSGMTAPLRTVAAFDRAAGQPPENVAYVSHHVRRMSARGLVSCGLSVADRRVTEVPLTSRGRQALQEAAPGHVDLVRRLFFGGLPDGLVGPLSEALESVYASIIKQGSLPPPVDWHPAED